MFINMNHPLTDTRVLPAELIRVKRKDKLRLFVVMELTGSFPVTVGHSVTCSHLVCPAIILFQMKCIG